MKDQVIKALKQEGKPQAQFNELLQLFMKHPEHNYGQARFLNRAGFSKVNLDNLKYDIQKLYGIRQGDLTKPVVAKKPVSKKPSKNKKSASVKKLQKIFTDAPDDVKGGMKLREQYLFLGDDSCPDKLKILVADMISAFNNYMGAREEVQQMVADGKEETLFEMAKVAVENFELNKEIREELDYYNEHGEILGNHPIFADDMLVKKVDAMKVGDLARRKGSLRSYISRENKKLPKIKDADKKATVEAKIKGWQEELDLIEVRLGGDGKK